MNQRLLVETPPPAAGYETTSSSESSASSCDDSRIVAALEHYLAAREAGRPLDRQQFLDQHGDLADQLRPALEGVDLLVRTGSFAAGRRSVAGRSVDSDSWRLEPDDGSPLIDLGDFQIVREVGRGGMGVVYEARQKSLDRRVALKVLPPAAVLDGRQRKRFQHEARMAAQLQHPHIVPVHSVGSERGIPFYVMRFIDGVNLGAIISRLRPNQVDSAPLPPADDSADDFTQASDGYSSEGSSTGAMPAFVDELRPGTPAYHAWVARLGVAACEALEHAHHLGIVHRDIKPANLLLDQRGGLWVTDFGLARLRGDVRLTVTGDLIGTLRYMSPEQASGRQIPLDCRTDLYSLGATLYELLTLEPPFDGTDVAGLLRQIADQEPTPPCKRDTSLPRPLETIVLKAMSKEAEDRYHSAREMADDLTRFLNDEPILARPPSLMDRALYWKKRHRLAFRAGMVVIVAGMLGLLAATGRVWHEMRQTQHALAMQSIQRQRAEKNLDLAMKALDEAYLQVAESKSVREALGAEQSSALLRRALDFYERFTSQNAQTPEVHRLNAQAHSRAGDIHAELGEFEEAEISYRRAIDLLSQLAARYPETFSYAVDLSVAWNNLAVLLREVGRLDESLFSFRQALGQLEPMIRVSPDSYATLSRQAMLEHNMAIVLASLGFKEEARVRLQSSLERRIALARADEDNPELRHDLALTYMTLGGVERSHQAFDASVNAFRQATVILEGLAHDSPTRVEYKRNLGRSLYNHAIVLSQSGHSNEAEPVAQRASTLQRTLAREQPRLPGVRDDLALSICCLGHIQAALGRAQEAETSFREATQVWQVLAAIKPALPGYSLRLSRVHLELAWLLRDQGRHDPAIRELRLALQYDPRNPIIRNDLAWLLISHQADDPELAQEALLLAQQAVEALPYAGGLWNTLGVVLFHVGKQEEARAAFQKSMEVGQGGTSYDWFYLALLAYRQQDASAARLWFDRAVEGMTAQAFNDPDLLTLRGEVASALRLDQQDWSGSDDLGRYRASAVTSEATAPTPSCRSALGFGPTSITSFTLQRCRFPDTMKAQEDT